METPVSFAPFAHEPAATPSLLPSFAAQSGQITDAEPRQGLFAELVEALEAALGRAATPAGLQPQHAEPLPARGAPRTASIERRRTEKASAPLEEDKRRAVPVIAVPPQPLPVFPLPALNCKVTSEPHSAVPPEPTAANPSPETLRVDAPVVEVRIHAPVEGEAQAPAPSPVPLPPAPEPEKILLPAHAEMASPALFTAASPVEAPQASAATHQKEIAPPAPAENIVEPPAPPPAAPLKSVSLEFTPDGARDVRLRLSERAGEVRVSVHSTDPALSGVLKAGVHDLAGALVHAGYEAEAWSPGQGQQQNQQQQEQRQRRSNRRIDELDNESFGNQYFPGGGALVESA